MLLMCQEFELLCVLRLWDTLMAAEGPDTSQLVNASMSQQFNPSNQENYKIKRFEFIDFVAVAMIQRRRPFIFSRVRDFANVMEAL